MAEPGTSSLTSEQPVRDMRALLAAVSRGDKVIAVHGRISGLPPITLSPGQALTGDEDGAMLVFDGDGVALTRDNGLSGLSLVSPSAQRAVRLAAYHAERGTLTLSNLTCHGQVQLLFGAETQGGHVIIRDLAIAGADTRGQPERPFANGVNVLQGAVTLWNRADRDVTVSLDLDGVDIGTADHPVLGGGLFIAGNGPQGGGRIVMQTVRVGPVHADSGLPHGTTDTVAGGIFLLHGAQAETVFSGSVVTHGPNAVPVDNWGAITAWRVDGNVISHGPSAIGFVNAGDLGELDISGMIETFGDGARACGIYGPTGTLRAHAIHTHGAAAIGVQVLDRLDRLEVADSLMTEGEPGEGLVKGVMIEAPAHAIHIEHGGVLGAYTVGTIRTRGRNAEQLCNEGRLA